MGLYTFAICSTPFSFEGYLRQKTKQRKVIAKLKPCVDNITIFSNDNIINSVNSVSFVDAFRISDKYFILPIKIMLSILQDHGIINIDFADIITTLKKAKIATIAYGIGKGERKITKAFENLKNSPFFYNLQITKAQSILINITHNGSLKMDEMNELYTILSQVDERAEIIWGMVVDPELDSNEIRISVIVTGITNEEEVVEYIGINELIK